jgi:hypothetical protein
MKRLSVLAVLLMVALAVLGLGFARWTETLNIEGTVSTGNLDAQFVSLNCYDDEPVAKDYSDIDCWVDESDPRKLWITIKNAYPSINYYCEFDLQNTGSIPFHVDSVVVNTGSLPEGATVDVRGIEKSEQVHPNEYKHGIVHVHLNNTAAENADYTFSITINVGQWNEQPE